MTDSSMSGYGWSPANQEYDLKQVATLTKVRLSGQYQVIT